MWLDISKRALVKAKAGINVARELNEFRRISLPGKVKGDVGMRNFCGEKQSIYAMVSESVNCGLLGRSRQDGG